MKAKDIVNQLRAVVTKKTDKFSTKLKIVSITITADANQVGTVTVETESAHGLAVGSGTSVTDAFTQNRISSLTYDGDSNLVTATTEFPHDLKELNEMSALVVQASDAAYNGTFKVVDVPNRNTFTYTPLTAPATSPDAGSPYLIEDRIDGINGYFVVTAVPSATTFSYQIASINSIQIPTSEFELMFPVSFGQDGIDPYFDGNQYGYAHVNTRIGAVILQEQWVDMYTAKAQDEWFIFVSLGPCTSSRNRNLLSDNVVNIGKGAERRIDTIREFFVDIAIPAKNSASGGDLRDSVEDIAPMIYSALVGFKVPTQLSEDTDFFAGFISHDPLFYNKAVYAHRFVFATREDITSDDTFHPQSRAYLDINMSELNDDDVAISDAYINLDEVPQ